MREHDRTAVFSATLAPRAEPRMIKGKGVEDYLDQIGLRLQKARENACLSVDDVAFKTRIPRTVIEALEAEDFSVFSSPTYAKSFLSQYSSFLNVEAGIWLDALQPASFIAGEIVTPLWKAAVPMNEVKAPELAPKSSWFSFVCLLAISCGLVVAAIKGYEFFDSKFGNEVIPRQVQKEVEEISPPPKSPALIALPKPAVNCRHLSTKPKTISQKPAPRAIIVRP